LLVTKIQVKAQPLSVVGAAILFNRFVCRQDPVVGMELIGGNPKHPGISLFPDNTPGRDVIRKKRGHRRAILVKEWGAW
jgi:hypothetical protein